MPRWRQGAACVLAGFLMGCATLAPTPAHLKEALLEDPKAWVSGTPKGIYKAPLVLNSKDFVWTVSPMPGGEGAAFSRMAHKHTYASLWTLEEGPEGPRGRLRCEAALNETAYDIEGMAWVPGGEVLLAASRNGNLYMLEAKGCTLKRTLATGRPLVSLAIDARGEWAALGGADGGIGLLSLLEAGGEASWEVLHGDEIRALAFDRGGHLFSGGFDKRIVQWALRVGEGAAKLERLREYIFEGYVNDFSLDALGETLGVALSEEKAVRNIEVYQREKQGKKEPLRPGDGGVLVKVETGEQKAFFAHRGTVVTAGISPDGQMLVTGGFDKRILFHRAGEKPWEKTLGWSIRRLRFSPSGRYVWVAAWTPQNADPNKPSAPSALAYELAFGEEAFVRTPPQ